MTFIFANADTKSEAPGENLSELAMIELLSCYKPNVMKRKDAECDNPLLIELKKAFRHNPYTTMKEVKNLTRQHKTTIQEITYWFTTERKRLKERFSRLTWKGDHQRYFATHKISCKRLTLCRLQL